jgi:hypothetical protein
MGLGWHTPNTVSGGGGSGGASDPALLEALGLIAQNLAALTAATSSSSQFDGQYVLVIDSVDALPTNGVTNAAGDYLVNEAGDYVVHET